MEEKELIQKILALYEELKAEENGHYLPGAGFKYKEPPSGMKYRLKAKQLFAYAVELSKMHPDQYSTCQLHHTMEKEVDYVGDYSYKYHKGSNTPTAKSLENMVQMMKDASGHIDRDCVGLLIPPS